MTIIIQARARDAQDLGRRERLEVRVVERDDEVALGHDRRDAADHEGHRQRPDQRVDPEPGDDDAVRDPDGEADREAGQDADGRRDETVVVCSDTAPARP